MIANIMQSEDMSARPGVSKLTNCKFINTLRTMIA